jgi:hypothetical protein
MLAVIKGVLTVKKSWTKRFFMDKEKTVPVQQQGSSTGATSKRITATREAAVQLFRLAKQRLIAINNWDKISGIASATFELMNERGEKIDSTEPRVGNLIRIKLPAPPNPSGDGYDWVRIEKIVNAKDLKNDQELFGFHVRPTRNPLDPNQETAHFFTKDATSSFLVFRSKQLVVAMERGRNEKPNIYAHGIWNRIRNFLIALGGMLGLSKPQWKSLTDGMLKI